MTTQNIKAVAEDIKERLPVNPCIIREKDGTVTYLSELELHGRIDGWEKLVGQESFDHYIDREATVGDIVDTIEWLIECADNAALTEMEEAERLLADGIIATGHAAIDRAEADKSVVLNKYADPTEGPRGGLTIDEAREIAREDPSLIYATANSPEAGDAPQIDD